MRSHLVFVPLSVLLLLSKPVRSLSAQEASGSHDLAVVLRAGSPGIGLEVNKLLLSHLGVRVGGNYFRYSATRTQSDIRYEATLKLRGLSALVDLYPGARGSFHFTGGLFTSPVKVTAAGKPSAAGDFEINGNTYSATQVGTLDAEAKYSDVGPYFGLGFGTPANSHHGLVFLFDLGVVIGKAKVTLDATGATAGSQLASDLAAQARKTQDDINEYAQVYPVLSFGLGYRF
jgi:hypothetical protein